MKRIIPFLEMLNFDKTAQKSRSSGKSADWSSLKLLESSRRDIESDFESEEDEFGSNFATYSFSLTLTGTAQSARSFILGFPF